MENPYSLDQRVRKSLELTLGGEDKFKRIGRFLETVIDLMQLVTGGELWKRTAWGMRMKHTEEDEPPSTFVNFIPVKGSTDNRWAGMFTFSKSLEDPFIASSIYIEGGKGSEGGIKIKNYICNIDQFSTSEINTLIMIFATHLNMTKGVE